MAIHDKWSEKDFFPTPKSVIEQMLFGVDINNKVILEPHGGFGDIVDYCKENGAKEVIACEISERLRRILSSKCRIVCDDFLQLKKEDISHIHLIVANPPFSNEEKHFRHMWDIAPDGCEIISLCNHSMYKSSNNWNRESVKNIISDYGHYTELGDVFKQAERETNVNVGLIHLYKPKRDADTEFDGYFCEFDEEEGIQGEGIMQHNEIREYVNRYVSAVRKFDAAMEAANEINSLISPIAKNSGIQFGAFQKEKQINRDTFKKELQKSAWHSVFAKLDMGNYITSSVRVDINKFVEQQTNIPFSMGNIEKMMLMIIGTHASRMDRIIVEAFECICGFADGNSTALETWKTNSDYMINKRFIHPYICRDYISWDKANILIDDNQSDKIDDIIKALCYITGTDYRNHISLRLYFRCPYHLKREDGSILSGYDNVFSRYEDAQRRQTALANGGLSVTIDKVSQEWGKWHDWSFFRVRGYKKGTMHFEFKDEKVWNEFNLRVSKIKGWVLPKGTASTKKQSKKQGVTLFD